MGFDFSEHIDIDDLNEDGINETVKENVFRNLKKLLSAETENTEQIAEYLTCPEPLETLLNDEDIMELVQVLIEKVELAGKNDSIYLFNDKYDSLPQNIALPLLKGTASTEYNLNRGYLDTRLDSRLSEGNLADIFKALKGVTPTKLDDYRYYPINDSATIVIIPMNDWVNADIRVHKNAYNKTIYLFVNETGTFTTIAGQRFENPETIVFRGVFKSTDKGNLFFDNPRLEIPV